MVSSSIFYQFIDWRHDQIELSEPFDHEGTLTTTIIIPSVTIGISNWWNISFKQIIGSRYMAWGPNLSKHHREEGSYTNFDNALGGYLGDRTILLRYLLLNEGRGEGSRLFLGGGIVTPSENTLTKSPFLKDEISGEYLQHRHFSMSSGVQKSIIEIQYYYKKSKNPVFLGATMRYEKPLLDNEYGFSGSNTTEFALSILFNKNNPLKLPFSTSVIVTYEDEAFWDGIPAPNSENTIITPGFGLIWNTNFVAIALNIQKPIFLGVAISESGGKDYNEESDVWQFSINVRKILDYTIPFLYW